MDSAWYIVTAAVAARGQKRREGQRRVDTAASRQEKPQGERERDGSGLTTTKCLKDAEDVDIEVSESEGSRQGC